MQESIDNLQDLLTDLKDKSEKAFQVTLTIRSYAHSKKQMKMQCETLRRIIEQNFLKLIPCDGKQEDGLCSSLPLGVNKIINSRFLNTSSLAAFVPFQSEEIFFIESPNFIYYGINQLTKNLILIDKTELDNPNSLIFGSPGAGKSFLTKLEIICLFLKTLDDIYICDPEGEYFPLVELLKGEVLRLSATSKKYINPMDIIYDKRLTDEDNPLPDKVDFILSFCELIVGGGGGITSVERSLISRAAKIIYEKFLNNSPCFEKIAAENPEKNIEEINEILEKELLNYGETMPILEDLYDELCRYGEQSERISTSLEMYVSGVQNYFNHRSNININNRIVCFDIKNLGDSLKKLGMLIIQDNVWRTVSKNRKFKKKTNFYIDEFHLLLNDQQTAKYCVQFWKRFRKWGGVPVGITQNVQDLLCSNFSEQIQTILSNTMFFALLTQSSEDREILQAKLKISDHEAEFITNAEKGCGLLKFGKTIIPFNAKFPKDTIIYKFITSKLGETLIAV